MKRHSKPTLKKGVAGSFLESGVTSEDKLSEEDQVNQLLVEFRLLENTFNEFTARQNVLERALIEARSALETVKSLGSENPTEVLMPIGAGVLLKGTPPNSEKILVNVGANVVLEKSRDDATAILESRIESLEKGIVSIASQRSQIAERLESDRRVVQSIASRQVPQQ